MAAITWQNINAPSARDVGRELDGAQRGFTGGFDKLAEILQQREAVNQGVADRGRAAGAQEYLNTLQGFKTPEELQAARMSGALDQAFAKVDVRNQADVRGAAEARIASLYGQAGAANKYAVDQAAAPGALLVAQGNTARAPEEQDLLTKAVKQRLGEEPIKSATETQTNLNQKAAAVLTGKLQPVADETALLTARNAQAQAKIDAADRAANDAITVRAQTRRQESLDLPFKQGKLIQDFKLGFPLKNGVPDIAAMEQDKKDPTILERFHVQMARTGMVSATDTLDTQNFIESHSKSGPEARAALTKALATRASELNTSPINMLSGAERDKLGGVLDAIDRRTALAEKSNSLFVVGGKNAADSIDEIRKQVSAAVGPDDQDKVRLVMREVQNELTARPNSPLHIPSIVNAAATAQSWRPFTWDGGIDLSYSDYFKNSLYKSMKTPAYQQQLADYEAFKSDNPITMKQQAVQSILQSAGLPYSGYTPPQLLRNNTPATPPPKK